MTDQEARLDDSEAAWERLDLLTETDPLALRDIAFALFVALQATGQALGELLVDCVDAGAFSQKAATEIIDGPLARAHAAIAKARGEA